MALVLADRVQETTTTAGTGALTLNGAVGGFQSFAVVGNGNICYYTVVDGTSWEVGIGTYSTTGPTLSRTTVLSNSSGTTSPLTLSSAVKPIFLTYPAEKSVNLDSSGNVSPLGTVSSGTWQGSTVGVAYGGTGVTSSSGANSVMLRDANQNVTINRLNQNSTTITAAGGTTTLTAASTFSQILVGTGGQTFKLPDATTLTNTTTFEFNNNATGMLTITDYANATVGTVSSGGAAAISLLANATVGGTWDVHAYIPENVTWGTNSLALGATVITGGTWNGGTITPAYGGTGLTSYTSGGAIYATGTSTLTSGTLPVASGGTGATTAAGAQSNLNVPSTTGSGASGTWNINISGNAATATNASAAVALSSRDIRTLSPSSTSAGQMAFGFTSWANNNTSPYADYLAMRSYTDSSGGNDNLLMLNKSTIAMRVYQQAWGSSTAYSSYADVLMSNNYNSYAPTLTGGGASGTWNINITGSAGSAPGYLPLSGGTMTGNILVSSTSVGAQFGNLSVGYGGAYNTLQTKDGSSELYLQYSSTGNINIGPGGGYTTIYNSTRSPIYYDSNNTAYYLDPTSTSVLSAINLPAGSQSINTTTPGTSTYQLNFTGQGTADYAQAITWGWSSSGAQAGIYVQSSGSYGTKMYLATTDSFATGAKTAVTIDHLGVITTTRNYLQATGSLRAPIFYDSDDTTYYLDPNNTGIALSSNGIVSSGYGTNGGFQNRIYTSGRNRIWSFGNADAYGISYFQGGPDYIGLHFGTTTAAASQFWVSDSGISQTSASSRAPIFYDSNDTNYYADPAGFSAMSLLRLAGNWSAGPYLEAFTIRGTYPSMTFRATNGTGQYWLIHNDAGNNLLFYGAASGTDGSSWSQKFYINQNGDTVSTASSRAPIFYDSDNTGYYVDPASTSNVNAMVSYSYQGNGNVGGTGSAAWFPSGIYSGNGAQCWIYGDINRGGYATTNGGAYYGTIFYDTSNTGYYCDPNGTSRMGTINADVLYSYGNVTAYSDERLKTDWEILPEDFVEKLAKVKSGTYTRIDSGERQAGVGAQSLQGVLKEAVSEKEQYLGVNYGNAAMVSAVELAKYVTALEQRISQLEARL